MNKSPPSTHLSNSDALDALFEIFLFILLTAGAIYISLGLSSVVDLSSSDDNSYLLVGQLLPNIRPLPNWAPLYSYWFWGLFSIFHDPVVVFIRNAQILYLSSILLSFLALRSLRVDALLSFITVWCVAINSSSVLMFPRVYQFSLVIVLLTTIFAGKCTNKCRSVSICAAGAVYLAYVRPEFSPLAIVLWLITGYLSFKHRGEPGFSIVSTISLLIASTIPIWLFGSPLFASEYNRGFQAFAQGFALNLSRFLNSEINPYHNDPSTISRYFGASNSVLSSLLYSPRWFTQNIIWNLYVLIEVVSQTAQTIFSPSKIFGADVTDTSLLNGFRLLWIAPLIFASIKSRLTRARISTGLLFLASVLLLEIVACLITITDYRHGLLIAVISLILVVASFNTRRASSKAVSIGIALIVIALTPRWVMPPRNIQPNIGSVELARQSLMDNTRSLSICPGFLAPFIEQRFAIPGSQSNSLTAELRDVVLIGTECSQDEVNARTIERFRAHSRDLGYRSVIDKSNSIFIRATE